MQLFVNKVHILNVYIKKIMAINLLEQNLEAITQTLARLQKEGCNDEKILNELREERDKILKDLKL